MKSSKDSVSGFAHNKSATTGDDEGEITRVMSMDERPANLSQASIGSRKIHVAANEEMEKNDKRTTTMKSCLKASMVRNIDGKILGKDGKPLAYVRQAVRVSKVQHGMSSDNEGTEDHTWKAVDVHESSNAHDQQEPNRAKPVEMVSYASMINSDLKVKKKINFRSLHNSEQVAASDCVLPMAAVDAIKHKFDNTLVGFFVGKKVAFTLVK
ncbi:hypothetical protein Tco_0929752, partial [Tanacetum coccineum]